jgi:prephenate dehydrogenase
MQNIYIIGLGLIGGSLGLALKQSDRPVRILGHDTDKSAVARALAIGAIDKEAPIHIGVTESDLIILCSPLSSYVSLLLAMRPYLHPGCVITDTGSTKQAVMTMFEELLPDFVWGIGGHPMAGSEIQGINGADRYLFENAVYVLAPPANIPNEVISELTSLLELTGARIKVMSPDRHDEIVATISHIPHIAAASLVNLTNGDNETLMMAAGGFRDITRIASSNSGLWEDILLSNRGKLEGMLTGFIAHLQEFKEALAQEDIEVIREKLEDARNIRNRIPGIRKGLLPNFCDIICIVPDRPGIIGEIGALLGSRGINIVDIEILRAREGDGGTMRLGLPQLEDANQAVILLRSINVKAWVR